MGWNLNDLRNDLAELKSLYYKEQDPNKKYELSLYIFSLEDTIAFYSFNDRSKLIGSNSFDRTLHTLPKYRIYLPHVDKFKEILDRYKDEENKIYYVKEDDYNEDDLYNLTDKFYSHVGGKIYESYKEVSKNIKDRINYVDEPSEHSRTYVMPLLDRYYMDLGAKSDERKIIEAYIHELAHIIAYKQNDRRYHSRDMFVEIESLFFETLADEYLFTETGDIYFKALEKKRVDKQYKYATIMDIVNKAYNTVIDNSMHINKAEKTYNKLCRSYGLLNPSSVDVNGNMKYLVSYMCAIELLEIYRKDKDEALRLLDNLIREDKSIEEYEKITNNITFNEHTDGYIKRLTLEK